MSPECLIPSLSRVRARRLVGAARCLRGCPLPLFTEQSLLKSPLAPLGRKLAGTQGPRERGEATAELPATVFIEDERKT